MTNECDEPSVLGAGAGRPPTPTEADQRKAWRSLFIEHAIAAGIDKVGAAELFDAGSDDWDYSQDPKEALEAEMQYWTDSDE
jgi:hypothetical protein